MKAKLPGATQEQIRLLREAGIVTAADLREADPKMLKKTLVAVKKNKQLDVEVPPLKLIRGWKKHVEGEAFSARDRKGIQVVMALESDQSVHIKRPVGGRATVAKHQDHMSGRPKGAVGKPMGTGLEGGRSTGLEGKIHIRIKKP